MNYFCWLLFKRATSICSYSQRGFWLSYLVPALAYISQWVSWLHLLLNGSLRDWVYMLVFVANVSCAYPLEAIVIISSASRQAMRSSVNNQTQPKTTFHLIRTLSSTMDIRRTSSRVIQRPSALEGYSHAPLPAGSRVYIFSKYVTARPIQYH